MRSAVYTFLAAFLAAVFLPGQASAQFGPVITGITDDTGLFPDDGHTSDNTPTLHGIANPGDTVTVYADTICGVSLGTTPADGGTGTWSFTTGMLAEGDHLFTAEDSVGCSFPIGVKIDTIAPVTTITGFADDTGTPGDNITNDTVLLLTGTTEPFVLVEIRNGATLLNAVGTDPIGNWSFLSFFLPEGSYSLTATGVDFAGNTGAASAPLVVEIDTTAPVVPTVGAYDDGTDLLTGTFPSGDATDLATATIEVFVNSVSAGTSTITAGNWSLDTGALADGNYAFTARAIDRAGNISAASAALNVTLGSVAPPAVSRPEITLLTTTYESDSAILVVSAAGQVNATAFFPSSSSARRQVTGTVNGLGDNTWEIVIPFVAGETADVEIFFRDIAVSTNVLVVSLSNPIRFTETNTQELSRLSPGAFGGITRNDLLDISPGIVKAMADCEYSMFLTSLIDASITTDDIAEYLKDGWSIDFQTGVLTAPEGAELCLGGYVNEKADFFPPNLGATFSLGGKSVTWTPQECINETIAAQGFGEFSLIQDGFGVVSLLNGQGLVLGNYLPGLIRTIEPVTEPGLFLNADRYPVIQCAQGIEITFFPIPATTGQYNSKTAKNGDTTLTFGNGGKVTGKLGPLNTTCKQGDGQYALGDELLICENGVGQILKPGAKIGDISAACPTGKTKVGGQCFAPATMSISGTVAVWSGDASVTVTAVADNHSVEKVFNSPSGAFAQGALVDFSFANLPAGSYVVKAQGDDTSASLDGTVSVTSSGVALVLGSEKITISGKVRVWTDDKSITILAANGDAASTDCADYPAGSCQKLSVSGPGDSIDFALENIDKAEYVVIVGGDGVFALHSETVGQTTSGLSLTLGTPYFDAAGSVEINDNFSNVKIVALANGNAVASTDLGAVTAGSSKEFSLSLPPNVIYDVKVQGYRESALGQTLAQESAPVSVSGATTALALSLKRLSTAVTAVSFGVSPTSANAATTVTVNMTATTALVAADSITVKLGGYNFTAGAVTVTAGTGITGTLTGTVVAGATDTVVISGGVVAAGTGFTLTFPAINPAAGVIAKSGLIVHTSRDTTPVTSTNDLVISAPASLSAVTFSASPAFASSATTLTVEFISSVDLVSGNTITLAIPGFTDRSGATISAYRMEGFDSGVTFAAIRQSGEVVLTLGGTGGAPAGTKVKLGINGLAAPAASTIAKAGLTVRTTQVTTPVASSTDIVIAPLPQTQVTNVIVAANPLTTGSATTITVVANYTTALVRADKITVNLGGYTVAGSTVSVIPGTGMTGTPVGTIVAGAVEITGGTVAAGTRATFTITGLTNPAAGTIPKAGLTVHTSKDLAPAASTADIVITAVPVKTIGFTGSYSTRVAAGVAFPSQPQVTFYSAPNVVDKAVNQTVTLAIKSGPTNGKLTGTAAVAAVAGVATFTGLAFDTPGSYVLTASATGYTSIDTQTIIVTAGPVTDVGFTVSPATESTDAVMTVSFRTKQALGLGDSITAKLTGYTFSAGKVAITTGSGISGSLSGNVAAGATDTLVASVPLGASIAAGSLVSFSFPVRNPAAGTLAKAGFTVHTSSNTTPVASGSDVVISEQEPQIVRADPVQVVFTPGEPAQIIAESDTAFDPDEELTVTLSSTGDDATTVEIEVVATVDEDGNLVIDVVVPADTPESIIAVTITAVDSRGVTRVLIYLFPVSGPSTTTTTESDTL